MKKNILILIVTATIGSSAMASSTLECRGKWRNIDAVLITASVESNTTIKNIKDSSGQVTSKLVNADENYHPRKYQGYNRFTYKFKASYLGSCGLLLPKNVTDINDSFTAYDICSGEQGGGTLRLTCKLTDGL